MLKGAVGGACVLERVCQGSTDRRARVCAPARVCALARVCVPATRQVADTTGGIGGAWGGADLQSLLLWREELPGGRNPL